MAPLKKDKEDNKAAKVANKSTPSPSGKVSRGRNPYPGSMAPRGGGGGRSARAECSHSEMSSPVGESSLFRPLGSSSSPSPPQVNANNFLPFNLLPPTTAALPESERVAREEDLSAVAMDDVDVAVGASAEVRPRPPPATFVKVIEDLDLLAASPHDTTESVESSQ
jgi:hypothetical protein